LFMVALSDTALIEYAVIALVIIAAIYIILKLGKKFLKWIFGILINSILGFVAIFLLNYFFALGIPFSLAVIISTALFGLPAVGTIAILKVLELLRLRYR
jgi:hypothetical protein